MYLNTKTLLNNINKINTLTMGHLSKVVWLLIVHTQHHTGPWTVDQAYVGKNKFMCLTVPLENLCLDYLWRVYKHLYQMHNYESA